jgi:3',5'-cyclic AMP phosphodiesterase CpdA
MADVSPQSFRFAVINDLHYTDDEDRPWLEGLVEHINATGAELCLVLGDLVEHGTAEELEPVHRILQRLKMPYYTVPGNHDGPPERPAGGPEGLEAYERLFPGRRNYIFEHKGWQFVGLDSTDGGAWKNVIMRPESLAFAKAAAARLDKKKPTIVFTHFPLDPTVRFNMLNGADLADALRPLNVRIVFGGHFHGLTQSNYAGVESVTNRCCSMRREIHDGGADRGYFVCTATSDGKVLREFAIYSGPSAKA